jgi:hypothetical protein
MLLCFKGLAWIEGRQDRAGGSKSPAKIAAVKHSLTINP